MERLERPGSSLHAASSFCFTFGPVEAHNFSVAYTARSDCWRLVDRESYAHCDMSNDMGRVKCDGHWNGGIFCSLFIEWMYISFCAFLLSSLAPTCLKIAMGHGILEYLPTSLYFYLMFLGIQVHW